MQSISDEQPDQLLRLKEVLQLIPVSRSSWYRGISCGQYPKPLKLSKRTVAWSRRDILSLISELSASQEK